MSLSFSKRVCLRKPISFSLAVKTQINVTITYYKRLNKFKVSDKVNRENTKDGTMTEREAGGWREGVNDLLSVEHRQLLVKWLPSPRALFFSCMRDHIKLTVNLCFKVDDLLC